MNTFSNQMNQANNGALNKGSSLVGSMVGNTHQQFGGTMSLKEILSPNFNIISHQKN